MSISGLGDIETLIREKGLIILGVLALLIFYVIYLIFTKFVHQIRYG